MRIAFVVGSLSGGGAERVVSEVASELAVQGHQVAVLLIASMKQTYELHEKVQVIDCTRRGSVPGLNFFNRVLSIRKNLLAFGADICLSFTVAVNIYAVLACMFMPCKLILAERNDPRFDPQSKLTRFLRCVLYPFAHAYVFQTEGEKVFFSKQIQKRSAVIPNPVNPDLPQPFTGERSKRFVTAVRLEPQKNLKMAIDAFSMVYQKHKEFRFEIYGNGAQRSSLEKYVQELHLEHAISFMGNSKSLYTDILDAYGFILSSDYEGMSNSMLEAMAMGIPTISTDHPSGGASAVIRDHESGILVGVGDTEAMAAAMLELIETDGLANTLSTHGKELKEQLHVTRISTLWLDYIQANLKN